MNFVRRKEAKLLAAVAAGGLILSPALAATSSGAKKKPAAIALSFDPISSFTPANADPKLAARFAGKGLALTDFKFTPAPAKGRPSQVRVAICARSADAGSDQPRTDERAECCRQRPRPPTSYNLGVAIGWKRFAVSGDVAQLKDTNPAARRSRERNRRGELFAPALHWPRRRRCRAY